MSILRLRAPSSRRRFLALLVSVVGLLAVTTASSRASNYSPRIPFPPACGICRMYANETLTDGSWVLKMQGDGNLVMRNSAGTACFASGTNGSTNAHVSYQGDGNFVVYSTGGTALWASNTAGKWIGSGYNVSINSGYFYVGNTFIHGPC
jgi:hypothetical protein